MQQVREELAEALHCDAEDIPLPRALAGYSADVILEAMKELEIDASDLQREDVLEVLQSRLEQEELDSVAESLAEEDPDAEKEDEESEEPTQEEKAAEKTQEKPPAPLPSSLAELNPEQLQAFQQRIAEVAQRAQQVNEPIYTEAIANALAGPLGVAPENLPAQTQAIQVLEVGAQNLIETALPALVKGYLERELGNHLEGHFGEGFHQQFTEDMLSRTWDSVRGNDLPKFGTEEFQKLADEVHEKHPYLATIDFRDDKGNPLPLRQALHAKAELVARLCRGERPSPKHIAEAISRAKEDANRTNRRVSASRALNSGKSKGQFHEEERTTSLRDAYLGNPEHGGGF